MTRGGLLSDETARRLGDTLRGLKARVGALEGRTGGFNGSIQRDDLYIAIPQEEITAATVTPTLITPSSGLCDLFHWNGTALVKRGTRIVYNFRDEVVPPEIPVAIHREWTSGKFFALGCDCEEEEEGGDLVTIEIGLWGQTPGGFYHRLEPPNWQIENSTLQFMGGTRWISWSMFNFPWADRSLYSSIKLQIGYVQFSAEMALVPQPWEFELYALKMENPMWSGVFPLTGPIVVADAAWPRTAGIIVNLDDAPVPLGFATQLLDVTAIIDEILSMNLLSVAWILKPLWGSDITEQMGIRLHPSEVDNPFGQPV